MREFGFEVFLNKEPSIVSEKAIIKRISEGRRAEGVLGRSLDFVVRDDDLMYEALVKLQPYETSKCNPMQHAVRKYYKFINDKEFPRLKSYHSVKHP